MTDKAELRRSLLRAREAIHPELWQQKSDRICAHLQSAPLFTQARTVLAYISFRQEPDLSPLLHSPRLSHYRWGLPRCEGKSLIWHLWQAQGFPALQSGAYGILEPQPQTPTLSPADVDLILVPAIACDVWGYRLGYGGGFYDRMLSNPDWRSKPKIGIMFEFARLPKLPIDPWDRPLDGVCTETGLFLAEDMKVR